VAAEGSSSSSPWRDVPVLVTGATGLLGSALCARLLARGARVTALVRDDVPESALVRSGDVYRVGVVRGAVEDLPLAQRAVAESQAEVVFHLAAQTLVGTARALPVATFEANVRGTWNVLEACRTAGPVRAVVVASSDKAYGDQGDRACVEEDPLGATHPYDASKACADQLARSYAHTYDLPAAVTRCGNLYGAGDLNWSRLVPGTLRSLLRGQRPIVRSDGHARRDWLYVDDAADLYERVGLALLEPPPGERVRGSAFNGGGGDPVAVLDVVDRLRALVGRPDLEPVVLGGARDEIPSQALCNERARRVLGWAPLTALDDGLAAATTWYRGLLGG